MKTCNRTYRCALPNLTLCVVVADGAEGPEFDGFAGDTLKFTPDSRHVACVGVRGGKCYVVVDGVEGAAYRDLLKPVLFHGPNLIRVVGYREDAMLNRELFRVEIEIVEGK